MKVCKREILNLPQRKNLPIFYCNNFILCDICNGKKSIPVNGAGKPLLLVICKFSSLWFRLKSKFDFHRSHSHYTAPAIRIMTSYANSLATSHWQLTTLAWNLYPQQHRNHHWLFLGLLEEEFSYLVPYILLHVFEVYPLHALAARILNGFFDDKSRLI